MEGLCIDVLNAPMEPMMEVDLPPPPAGSMEKSHRFGKVLEELTGSVQSAADPSLCPKPGELLHRSG